MPNYGIILFTLHFNSIQSDSIQLKIRKANTKKNPDWEIVRFIGLEIITKQYIYFKLLSLN